MKTKCARCGCLESEEEKHGSVRDCLIAVTAAKGQVEDAIKASNKAFNDAITELTSGKEG